MQGVRFGGYLKNPVGVLWPCGSSRAWSRRLSTLAPFCDSGDARVYICTTDQVEDFELILVRIGPVFSIA